jgi:hypothetical protein
MNKVTAITATGRSQLWARERCRPGVMARSNRTQASRIVLASQ